MDLKVKDSQIEQLEVLLKKRKNEAQQIRETQV
jgi:hypothetical protein